MVLNLLRNRGKQGNACRRMLGNLPNYVGFHADDFPAGKQLVHNVQQSGNVTQWHYVSFKIMGRESLGFLLQGFTEHF